MHPHKVAEREGERDYVEVFWGPELAAEAKWVRVRMQSCFEQKFCAAGNKFLFCDAMIASALMEAFNLVLFASEFEQKLLSLVLLLTI